MLSSSACLKPAGSRFAVKALASISTPLVVQSRGSVRLFTTTQATRLRDFFPEKDTHLIKTTPAAWPHHGYTMAEMKAVVPAHREPRTTSDWLAWKTVRFARYWMDKATGMDRDQQVDKSKPTTSVDAEKPLTESQWVSLS